MKLLHKKTLITSTVALLALTIGAPSVASHRVILFNEKAMEKVLDMWPDFVIAVNNQARGVDDPGGRGIILQSPLRAHLNQLLREQPTPEQYGFGFKQLVSDYLPVAQGRQAADSLRVQLRSRSSADGDGIRRGIL
jgi:hypothetical protein